MLLWVSTCRTVHPAPDKLLQRLLCYQGKGLPRAGKSGGAGDDLEVLERRVSDHTTVLQFSCRAEGGFSILGVLLDLCWGWRTAWAPARSASVPLPSSATFKSPSSSVPSAVAMLRGWRADVMPCLKAVRVLMNG